MLLNVVLHIEVDVIDQGALRAGALELERARWAGPDDGFAEERTSTVEGAISTFVGHGQHTEVLRQMLAPYGVAVVGSSCWDSEIRPPARTVPPGQ